MTALGGDALGEYNRPALLRRAKGVEGRSFSLFSGERREGDDHANLCLQAEGAGPQRPQGHKRSLTGTVHGRGIRSDSFARWIVVTFLCSTMAVRAEAVREAA